MRLCAWASAALLWCLWAPRLAAQEVLDRGTFVILREGVEIGREEFAIRSTAGRQGQGGLLAVSTVRYRDRETQHALELTRDLVPLSHQETGTAGGRVVARLSAQLSGNRYSARLISAEGESTREFAVSPPVALLGADAFHHFYFVPRATTDAPRRVSVVRVGDTRAAPGWVHALGPDTVMVGQRPVVANRFALRLADGDERHFWFTPEGDLVQVAVPAESLVATRAEPPRR